MRSGRRALSSAVAGTGTGVRYGGMGEKALRHLFQERPPFVKLLGFQVLTIEENKTTMGLEFKNDLIGNLRLPSLHGGVTATFIDHCSGLCAWSTLRDPYQTVSTVDLRVDYLSPARCESHICEAEIVQKGNKLIRVDATVWNQDRTNKVALGRVLFKVIKQDVNIGKAMEEAVLECEKKQTSQS